MKGDTYPRFRAGVVHASPVFLDRDATIDKLGKIVEKAKEQGADIVVFPESFVPAFPLWCIVYAPLDQHDFYRRLFDHSILIPGPAFSKLAEIAKSQKIFLSVGVTEKSDYSMGAMWNTNLLFDRNGILINRHRKIMPTWAEKLIWALGDGSQLRPAKTEIGNIGTLICGENTNPLCRYALLAQGEQIHISTYPPAWPFQRGGKSQGYDVKKLNYLRAAAHSFEGKVFNLVSSGVLDQEAIDRIARGNSDIKEFLEKSARPSSFITGPNGEQIAEIAGEEGIVYADIDLSESIIPKQAQDIVGYYNRFDIFQLKINQTPHRPITCYEREASAPATMDSDIWNSENTGEERERNEGGK
ncbi:MAG: Nitrilase [Deltaproteobacteria bacterium]|nr:Nitrilase [Deltaproteobacteria bacterium]